MDRSAERLLDAALPRWDVTERHWLVIRPGSGLIRRELLRAVARRAEAIGG